MVAKRAMVCRSLGVVLTFLLGVVGAVSVALCRWRRPNQLHVFATWWCSSRGPTRLMRRRPYEDPTIAWTTY